MLVAKVVGQRAKLGVGVTLGTFRFGLVIDCAWYATRDNNLQRKDAREVSAPASIPCMLAAGPTQGDSATHR